MSLLEICWMSCNEVHCFSEIGRHYSSIKRAKLCSSLLEIQTPVPYGVGDARKQDLYMVLRAVLHDRKFSTDRLSLVSENTLVADHGVSLCL